MSSKSTRQERAIERLLAEREELKQKIRELKITLGATIHEKEMERATNKRLREALRKPESNNFTIPESAARRIFVELSDIEHIALSLALSRIPKMINQIRELMREEPAK